MKNNLGALVIILGHCLSATVFAGAQFPISFSKSVCPDDFENRLMALQSLNKEITDELATCTAGVFKDSGATLFIESIAIRSQFSHMCNTSQQILFAEVVGKCVIP